MSAAISNFRDQAAYCRQLGSPFTGAVLDLAAERLEAGNASWGAQIVNWAGDPKADALALRLAGALHRAVLDGGDTELARAYLVRKIDAATLDAALTRHRDLLAHYLQSPPQTNDPQRSAVLLGGFLQIAASCPGLALQTCEIGASAGLNLSWDAYAYDYGSWQQGDASSAPLTLTSRWGGSRPPDIAASRKTMPRVIARAGCDVAPLDAASPADRLRLLSYIWADQPERLERVRRALDHAQAQGIHVTRANAGDFVAQQLEARRGDAVFVLYHSIVWQYIAAPEQRRITALMRAAGHHATPAAPIAWLRLEPGEARDGADLTVTIWDGKEPGGVTTRLGAGDFHGRWVRRES